MCVHKAAWLRDRRMRHRGVVVLAPFLQRACDSCQGVCKLRALVRIAGKDVTKNMFKKKDGKGGWKHKAVDIKSAFHFFSPPRVPDDGASLSTQQKEQLEQARSTPPAALP